MRWLRATSRRGAGIPCLVVCSIFTLYSVWKSSYLSLLVSSNTVEHSLFFPETETTPTLAQSNTSSFVSHPRLVALVLFQDEIDGIDSNTGEMNYNKKKKKMASAMQSHHEKRTNYSDIAQQGFTIREFERHWFQDCTPILNLTSRPTCNTVHELDAFGPSESVSLLSMEGSLRSVWRVAREQQQSHRKNSALHIFKALHLDIDWNEEVFRQHLLDSMIMERLTSSPHVVSSFGYCGPSVITEFANRSARDLIKDPSLRWKTRVKLARDLTRGLAELHALKRLTFPEKPVNASPISPSSTSPLLFSHHDINVANIVSISGESLQWNDFNLGILSRQESHSLHNGSHLATACPVPVRYQGPLWRSPEEIKNTYGVIPTVHSSDVYSLGSMLFNIMTKHQPWTNLEKEGKLSKEQVTEYKLLGRLPNLPPKYVPRRPEAYVLWEATKACFRVDPQQRPTAFQLAYQLGIAYQMIGKRDKPSPQVIQDLFAASVLTSTNKSP